MNKSIKLKLAAAVLCLAISIPGKALAAQEDVDRVNEMISSLPAQEDMGEDDAETVRQAMELYESLTMAEKIRVEDYDKLEKEYRQFVETGVIRDEKKEQEKERQRLKEEQDGLKTSAENEPEATQYVFVISDQEPSLSVVLRYVTDRDGDGYGDMPDRLVLTSPSGTTTSISNANTNLENESMNITLTWEKKFLQLDIAEAENGKWKITTSDPVTFSSMPYAGVRKEIRADDEKAKEDAGVTPQETEEETGSGNAWRFVLIGAAIAAMIAVFIFVSPKRRKKADITDEEDEDDDDDEYDAPEDLTEEERIEQIRKDHQERMEQERLQEEEAIRAEEEEEYNRKKDQVAKESIDEYTEGDTDLLNSKENPVKNGGGLKTGGFFKRDRFA